MNSYLIGDPYDYYQKPTLEIVIPIKHEETVPFRLTFDTLNPIIEMEISLLSQKCNLHGNYVAYIEYTDPFAVYSIQLRKPSIIHHQVGMTPILHGGVHFKGSFVDIEKIQVRLKKIY
jgi:hypothetical protein